MASEQERAELDARARQGETVVPGGTRGKSLEAQEHLAEVVEVRLERSSLELKGTKRWAAKVDLAPWTNPEESVQKKKGSRLTSPSSELVVLNDLYHMLRALPSYKIDESKFRARST